MKTQSDYLLTYTNSWGDHSLTATAGFTTYYNKLENLNAARTQGVGLVIPDNPDKWYVSIGDAGTSTNGSTQWERSTVSVLARILITIKVDIYSTVLTVVTVLPLFRTRATNGRTSTPSVQAG